MDAWEIQTSLSRSSDARANTEEHVAGGARQGRPANTGPRHFDALHDIRGRDDLAVASATFWWRSGPRCGHRSG